MAIGWLEALNSDDLGLAIAGNHYAAVQSMDEEYRREIRFNGAFGARGAVVRSVRDADESTVSFSAIILKPGEDIGMADEQYLLDLGDNIKLVCKRGSRHVVHDNAALTAARVASTLDQVTLNGDFSVPGYRPPSGAFWRF